MGESPKQGKLGILSWLVLSPFQVVDFSTRWLDDKEKLQQVVQRADKITTRFPQIPPAYVVDRICTRVGLEGEATREQALVELRRIKANKNGPIWAPWDIVFQPGIQFLIIAAGLLGLFLLATSL